MVSPRPFLSGGAPAAHRLKHVPSPAGTSRLANGHRLSECWESGVLPSQASRVGPLAPFPSEETGAGALLHEPVWRPHPCPARVHGSPKSRCLTPSCKCVRRRWGRGDNPGWTFREGFPGPPLNALLWPWDQWCWDDGGGPQGCPVGPREARPAAGQQPHPLLGQREAEARCRSAGALTRAKGYFPPCLVVRICKHALTKWR